MDYGAIVDYFEDSAETGAWNSLYNPRNPDSYSFIVRLQKAINLAGSFMNKRVLDLGCGTGVLIPFVIGEKGEYIGLDTSEKMLGEVKRNYPDYFEQNKEKVSLIPGDIRKIQLPDKLDIVIGLGFIEYFDNADEVIKNLYNKLSKGGRLILSFPNACSLDYLFVRLFLPFRYLARKVFGKFTHQPPHRLWDIKTARRLYSDTGFKNIRTVNYNANIFTYPITKISIPFINFWAKRFEYSILSKWSFFATGFLISGDK